MTARRNPLIAVVNQSTVVKDAELANVIHALAQQVTYDFEPHWNTGCSLLQVAKGDALADHLWALVIADDSDQAGALGYHEVTHSGQPVGFVFAKTDIDYGLSWTVTASHELLEMLVDPFATTCAQVGQQQFVALEVADACEDDALGYRRLGVDLSDFVYPAWFNPQAATGPFDFKGHLRRPLELAPGGYIGSWTPSHGWTQLVAGEIRHAAGPRFQRRQRRAASAEAWRAVTVDGREVAEQ